MNLTFTRMFYISLYLIIVYVLYLFICVSEAEDKRLFGGNIICITMYRLLVKFADS